VRRSTATFPGAMEAGDLPRSRYLQVSNEAPAVKGGAATESSEAPLTGGGSAVARLPSGAGVCPPALSLAILVRGSKGIFDSYLYRLRLLGGYSTVVRWWAGLQRWPGERPLPPTLPYQ
jgi:hypothetical protein